MKVIADATTVQNGQVYYVYVSVSGFVENEGSSPIMVQGFSPMAEAYSAEGGEITKIVTRWTLPDSAFSGDGYLLAPGKSIQFTTGDAPTLVQEIDWMSAAYVDVEDPVLATLVPLSASWKDGAIMCRPVERSANRFPMTSTDRYPNAQSG